MNELAPALVKALTGLMVLEKSRTVDFRTDSGKRVNYDYASLDALVLLTRPVLAAEGLVALTSVHEHGDGYACTVQLLHTSGECMEFQPLPFPRGHDAQSSGSWITYFRRYALLAALGMATGEDDDGAKAVGPQPVDDYTPGLRTSVEAAIGKLDDAGREALKAWLAEEDLPAVRRMNADQLARTIDHLMELPSWRQEGEGS